MRPSRFRAGLLAASLSALLVAPAGAAPNLINTAAASYDPGNGVLVQTQSPNTLTAPNPALSVSSGLTACQGGPLADYSGWTVGLYSTDAAGNPLNALTTTRTQLPAYPTIPLPSGVAPNNQNANPFAVTNGNNGLFVFLLDPSTGQTANGSAFVLVTNAPKASSLPRRRVRIVLGATAGSSVAYTATAVDGMAINATSPATTLTGTFPLIQTSAAGTFAVMQLGVNECPSNAVSITKTANVPIAAVGDTVVYTVTVTNQSLATVDAPTVTDILPLGFAEVRGSERGAVGTAPVPITVTLNGSRLTLATATSIPASATLTFVYATVISPDALKGTAQNVAVVDGTVTAAPVHGGPAAFTMKLDPGILSDCGTIIGRVYIDRALKGKDRREEPGVPDAVVYFDDGVRVKTDLHGLYHYPGCAHPGWRSAVLDLQSVPGYTLAPNIYIFAKNGQSQSAHLEPSGMVRINFAVIPVAKDGAAR